MKRFKINVENAANGVYLSSKFDDAVTAAYHGTLHSKRYFDEVFEKAQNRAIKRGRPDYFKPNLQRTLGRKISAASDRERTNIFVFDTLDNQAYLDATDDVRRQCKPDPPKALAAN